MSLSDRYAPGGDIYEAVKAEHGAIAADRVWRAHQSGEPGAVAEVLAELRYGAERPTSTAGILLNQLVTDPLGAPLDAANRGLGNIIGNTLAGIFRNPWVLGAIALGVWLWWKRRTK
jgi:hypothetical protein